MLEIRGMARSTFYYHTRNCGDKYRDIRKDIYRRFLHHRKRYGYRRICEEMRSDGIVINHKTVAMLMRMMGLRAERRRKRYRSFKGEVGRIAPNLLDRDFSATAPNQKWTTDVTQIHIGGQRMYLSPILDMWDGSVISYSLSSVPGLEMISSMLDKAFRKHKDVSGLVMHSDQGWQYQHRMYQKALQSHGIIQSMSRRGNCLDNAMMESFFALMKNELLYANEYESVEEFKRDLRIYIRYYNEERIKLRLGMSPAQYRKCYYENNKYIN